MSQAEVRRKFGQRIGRNFLRIFVLQLQNDPPNFSRNSSQFITPCLVAAKSKVHVRELLGFGGPNKKQKDSQRIIVKISGTHKNGNGKVQTNIRTNNSERFEGTAHENLGFEAKRVRKFIRTLPQTLPWNFIPILFASPNLSAFLKHAFREVTCGFCKGTVPGAPPRPSPGP